MTDKKTEALKLAWRAMANASPYGLTFKNEIAAIREALAEQEKQEPVAWVGEFAEPNKSLPIGTPLYAAPVDAKAIRAEERKRIVDMLIAMHEKTNGQHNCYLYAANTINGAGYSD
jgi:hypothetical protein